MTAPSRPPLHVIGLQEFLSLLDVEELDRDLYRARNPQVGRRRVLYGGQVLAQALRAAAATVSPDRFPHSLHGYFLRPGQVDRPTILHVNRDRDGRSFSARHVVAVQDSQVILSVSVSFHVDEPGVDVEIPPEPEVASPVGLIAADPQGSLGEFVEIFEFGLLERERQLTDRYWTNPRQIWMRTRGPVGSDRVVHACVQTYASDISTGFGDLGLPIMPPAGGPTIDHSLWFHRRLDTQDWFLLDQAPVVSAGARGLYQGGLYDQARRRCTSLAQEILTRLAP
jgi:acyl-CoA thioesterase-2